jgi:hypothetical protein
MATMSKLQGVRPGWADLPCDLLESVLRRLPVPDRLRFPAVCTAWQSTSTTHQDPTSVPPSPWLMLPFNPTKSTGSDAAAKKQSEALRFLSLAEGRTYAIREPASDRLCFGSSSDGWLVTADAASELHLLNPVTGAHVPLPSVTTLPHVDAARGADGRVASYSVRSWCFSAAAADEAAATVPPETFAPDRLRYELYEKAVVVSGPDSPAGHAVLLICQPLFRLAVARAGNAAWTLLDTPGRFWVDAVRAADNGGARVVYAMDTSGRVDAWDVDAATPELARAVAPPCSGSCLAMSAAGRRYLVELSPGRLLQVHRLRDAAHERYKWEPRPERVEYTTAKVELFLFECTAAGGGGRDQWTRVDSSKESDGVLAGLALFLGKNASLCIPGVDGGCPAGLRGNCVYFTDDGLWSHERCHEVTPDVGVLDLADGTYRLPRGALRDLLWKWPPPVWVFPSLGSGF